MKFIEELKKKELLYQQTNTQTKEVTGIYCGFDGTAESLQIGNLHGLAVLRLAYKHNIPTIALVGGATSQVGDPSEKSETRKKIENNQVEINIKNITKQIKKLVPNAKIVNNIDWLAKLNFMDFSEKVAKHISVSSLIKLKTFASRLTNNDPFSTQELIYPLMQAYDFLYLYENENCNTQCGGSDQWCNILTGTELIRKKIETKENELLGITFPLLTDSNGKKMGKSLKGAIYCSEHMCSIYDFWQFWRNVEDVIVKPCLKKLTTLSVEEIDGIENINEAKTILANEITTWIHSKEEATAAQTQAKLIFIEKNTDELTAITVSSNKIIEILVEIKATASNSNAKKLIEQGAVKIDGKVILQKDHKESKQTFILSVGKKSFYKIQPTLA